MQRQLLVPNGIRRSYLLLIVVFVSWKVTESAENDQGSPLARLMSHIRTIPVVKDKVPPVVADSTGKQSVHASASLSVASVISVDDVQQTVTTVNYFRLYWQDKSLAWNESDYDGIQFLELPVNSIWTPSVNVINSMDNTEAFGLSSDVVISSDGSLHVRSYFITETFCGMDLSRYPFDEQNCPMVLLSFSKFLNLVISDDATGKAVAAMFSVSAEWDLLSTSAVPFYLEEYNVNGTVVMIKFRRKTTFYTVCLVLPMALTSYMNTLVFLVPLQSGEKVSFLVSIFVSTSVYVSYFTTVMPRGLDSVPDILKLLTGVIIESFLVLLGTIVVMRRFHQQQQQTQAEAQGQHLPADGRVSSRETTAWEREVTTSPLCCKRDCRVQALQDGASPADEDQPQKTQLPAERGASRKLTAERLDRIFFVLAFTANTIFLSVLLHFLVSSGITRSSLSF